MTNTHPIVAAHDRGQPIMDAIEPKVLDRLVSRRDALRRGAAGGASLAAMLATGSVPLALGALANSAYAQAPTSVLGVLQFAYLLENLEAEFYKAALGTGSSVAVNAAFAPVRATLTPVEVQTFQQIAKHEVAHVALLRGLIAGAGATPATYGPASFDFTGGNGAGNGPFAAATTDKAFLLAGAQAFEDTGVRAYKGQAGNLISNDVALETALRIHSVEARHAARIRRMRAAAGVQGVNFSGTITGEQSGISGLSAAGAAVVAQVYDGEDNVTHAPSTRAVDATAAATAFGGAAGATEAFDEPLSYDQVVAIVAPFVVGNAP